MIEPAESVSVPETTPLSSEMAIARCRAAWDAAFQKERAKGTVEVLARVLAHRAYRQAMPVLQSPESLRDFIACVSYGMCADIILEPRAAKLLYAAQVAVTVFRNQPGPPKAPAA